MGNILSWEWKSKCRIYLNMILNVIVFLYLHSVLHFLEVVQFCYKWYRYSVKGRCRGKMSLLLSNSVICRLGLTEVFGFSLRCSCLSLSFDYSTNAIFYAFTMVNLRNSFLWDMVPYGKCPMKTSSLGFWPLKMGLPCPCNIDASHPLRWHLFQ
jgi:hypothetical protein